MAFTLTISAGNGSGQSFAFDQPEITIGRTADNDVVLYEAGVSRRHVRIWSNAAGEFHIEDLGSSNGTQVNGARIDGVASLASGDSIAVGSITFQFGAGRKAIEAGTRIIAVDGFAVAAGDSRGRRTGHLSSDPEAFEATAASELERRAERRATARRSRSHPRAGLVGGRSRRASKLSPGSVRALVDRLSAAQRRLLIAGTAIALLVPLLFVVLGTRDGAGGILSLDRSDDRFPIGAEATEATYGLGPDVKVPTADKVEFEWRLIEPQPGSTLVTLSYASGHIRKEDSVEIRLNGAPIGFAAPALGEWQSGNELILPRKLLKPNEMNQIVFDNLANPKSGGSERWEVGEVRLISEQLPICTPTECLAQAKRFFELGQRDVDNKSVAAANLFQGWLSLRKARLYLEPMEPKPALYELVLQVTDDVFHELGERCSKMRFTATRHYALKNIEAAQAAARDILLYFPGTEHPCHGSAKRMLEYLRE